MTDEKRQKLLDVPADLLDRVTSLAGKNRRSANAEIVVAIEQHLSREDVPNDREEVTDPLKRP
jgi:predicted transcriptional regulator